MAFPLRTLSWAFVTLACIAALLLCIFRPEVAAPVLGVVVFSLYVGLVTEAILDVTSRDDIILRQRIAWLALCILVLPLVPVMAGAYFLLGRRQTALMVGGPRVGLPEPWAGRVPHRTYTIVRWGRRG